MGVSNIVTNVTNSATRPKTNKTLWFMCSLLFPCVEVCEGSNVLCGELQDRAVTAFVTFVTFLVSNFCLIIFHCRLSRVIDRPAALLTLMGSSIITPPAAASSSHSDEEAGAAAVVHVVIVGISQFGTVN